MYSESRRSLVDFHGMLKILEDPHVQPQPLPGARPLFEGGASTPVPVSFEKVQFRYPSALSDTPLLQSVTLGIHAGGTLGIVGMSGAGKSSLFRLLFRFYDPEDGCIKLCNRDIRN